MKTYTRDVLRSPERIVTNGKCQMGTFNESFKVVNLLDLDKPLGRKLPRFINNLRLKEWEAFQIANEDWFICMAVYSAKTIGVAFVMLYDKHAQKLYRYARQKPAYHFKVPSALMNSSCEYIDPGLSIEIFNSLEEGTFEISFQAKGFKGQPDCNGRITACHNTEPLVIVQPFGENRPLYSHKALMPGRGSLTFQDRQFDFENTNTAVIVDDHKGFYPYVSHYDWLTSLGYQGDNLIGFNLTDNQIQNPEKYNENCLWISQRMVPLPPIKVNRPNGIRKKWTVCDEYGHVNLSFTPISGHPFSVNMGFISTYYYGPIGRLEGYILDSNNDKICFDDFIGMGEKRHDRI